MIQHFTQFEIALTIVLVPMLVVGVINFIWNISLGHWND